MKNPLMFPTNQAWAACQKALFALFLLGSMVLFPSAIKPADGPIAAQTTAQLSTASNAQASTSYQTIRHTKNGWLKRGWQKLLSKFENLGNARQKKAWEGKQIGLFALSVILGTLMIFGFFCLDFAIGAGGFLWLGGIVLTLFLFVLAMRAIFKKTNNTKQGIVVGLLALIAATVGAFVLALKDFDPF